VTGCATAVAVRTALTWRLRRRPLPKGEETRGHPLTAPPRRVARNPVDIGRESASVKDVQTDSGTNSGRRTGAGTKKGPPSGFRLPAAGPFSLTGNRSAVGRETRGKKGKVGKGKTGTWRAGVSLLSISPLSPFPSLQTSALHWATR